MKTSLLPALLCLLTVLCLSGSVNADDKLQPASVTSANSAPATTSVPVAGAETPPVKTDATVNAPATAAAAPVAAAAVASAPTPNKGDTAWMMVASLLVILMTKPFTISLPQKIW